MTRLHVRAAAASPTFSFGLLLAGAGLAASALAGAAGRLAVAGIGGAWPGLSAAGLRCLLVPSPSDLGAHVLSYLYGALLLACAAWTGLTLVRHVQGSRRLAAAVATRCVPRPPRALRRLVRRLGLGGRVDVVVGGAPDAFCYGLLRPRICLSAGLVARFTPAEVEAVLRHERYHLLQRDPLKLAVGRALATALCFFPIAGDLLRRYELARELAADRRAVAEMGGSRPLAGALYELIVAPALGTTYPLSWPAAHANSVAAAGAPPGADRPIAGGHRSTIELRIAHLVEGDVAPPPLISRRSAAFSALALAAVVVPPLLPAGSHAAAEALTRVYVAPGVC